MVFGRGRAIKGFVIDDQRPSQKEIEQRVKRLLKTDPQGRKIIEFRSGRLDFKEPFIFKGVTKSGNLKLQDTISTTLRSGKEGFPNVRGVLFRDTIGRGPNVKSFKVRTGKGTGTSFLDLGEF